MNGKGKKLVLTAALMMGLAVPATLMGQTAAEERGQALFNDPKAFGGQVSCNSCHPGGQGLERSGTKTRFRIMGERQNSLAEAINFCIINANKGEAIAEDSREMQDMIAYIKSLAAPAPAYGPPPPVPGPGYGVPPRPRAPGYDMPPAPPGPGYGVPPRPRTPGYDMPPPPPGPGYGR
ncbi:c-type cytochrome [Desulfurivibrio alkaliphilus]|uniref:Cytochrome c domain-containing protein n=1 Tax=Desulfurivibrio alkaliphilus (strain DSM 19089 / UNIQEM U267 / AHT2) TaxID=589865 RepID=D6Z1C8_DESAT|nr:hypothetical protein [Desulfurivibrio alkaliphilus]ADH85383.1 hypothetical protein DaAHT2_0679 [Desulfurivibrio alkaliphilus AHT 2]